MANNGSSFLERHWRSVFAAASVFVDSIAVFIALAIGYAINFQRFTLSGFLSHQWKLVVFCIVLFTGLGAIIGVYRLAYSTPLRLQLSASIRSFVLGTLLVFATLFLFRNTYYSNGALLTFLVVLPTVLFLCRWGLEEVRLYLHAAKRGLEGTVVFLVDKGLSPNPDQFPTYSLMGFDVRSVTDISGMVDSERRLKIAKSISEYTPTTIILEAVSIDSIESLLQFIELFSGDFSVRLISPEVHDALARTRLYDYAGIRLVGSSATRLSRLRGTLKWALDMLVSLSLMAIFAPAFIAISLAIVVESSGSVLFRQLRSVAPQSMPIRVFKFRSMRVGNDDARRSDQLKIRGEAFSKAPGDPRITKIGRIIRRYSFDEFPQLLNVVAGEMSLVGPRPLPASDFDKLSSRPVMSYLLEKRGSSRPGITGLWQVSGRSGLSFEQMVILDLYYAEHESLLFDLEILFETIPAVISGRGAY